MINRIFFNDSSTHTSHQCSHQPLAHNHDDVLQQDLRVSLSHRDLLSCKYDAHLSIRISPQVTPLAWSAPNGQLEDAIAHDQFGIAGLHDPRRAYDDMVNHRTQPPRVSDFYLSGIEPPSNQLYLTLGPSDALCIP